MAPSSLGHTGIGSFKGVERIRHELLAALHFGRLRPGDRVPSVRELAVQTGMNRKTVHRAYRRLSSEGLLELRPGSGTFICESLSGRRETASVADFLVAANRCRALAEPLGVPLEKFVSFLQFYLGRRFPDIPVAVTECNHEQLTWLEAGLRTQLGIRTRPVLLSKLALRPAASTRGLHGIVTTDCHRAEVADIVGGLDVPVYRVALDPRFPRQLLERARRESVIMLVRDRPFVPVFLRLLRQISGTEPLPGGLHIVETAQLPDLLGRVSPGASVYVSPLVRELAELSLPPGFRRVRARWQIEPGSLDRLRARLSLDLAANRDRVRSLVAG